ncbi:MAG: tyrosine--tRNA ligase [Lentisphaerae bacterium GWF2_52_8]|nr:MAG: tyrosine--tRNA ligase [Lentisphaerae bacterium GWF2_52_8]
MNINAYEVLKRRGFIYQATDEAALTKTLGDAPTVFYVGFDPTADSLHVGHLLPIMAMRQLQKAGHIPIVLVGGATALVGDPSGKQEARPILDKEKVAANAAALKQQLSRFISVEDGRAIFVNNADWFRDLLYIDFLREIGSRFSVNKMLSAESVKLRLETGLSFLEFNYMILQAYDFQVLNKAHKCRIQFGGQDQWGNIVAGVDLVRRMNQEEVFGATFPLLMNSQGQKFGKTAAGAVWLDPQRSSTFDYYQFWRNCDDGDVARLLCFFTGLPVDEIERLAALPAPAINRAKEILAYEATSLAHGSEEATKNYLAAGAKFGFADAEGRIATTSAISKVRVSSANAGFADLPSFSVPDSELEGTGVWIVKLLTDSGLCKSNGDARRLIQGGGAYLNDEKISDPNATLHRDNIKDGAAILKAGKKSVRRITIVP